MSAPAPPSTLLVATSDSGTRALLRKALHVRAVEVVEASDGVEALALARRLELDLVLLDAFLATLDCISVCARIRALPSISQPLIAIMGLSSERTVELAFSEGADEILPKPFHPALIRQRVEIMLRRKQRENRLRLMARALEAAGTGVTIMDARSSEYPVTYANRFKDYYSRMKAVDPTIKIGAVAVTGEDSYANYSDHPATNLRTGRTHNGWTPVLLTTLKSLGVTPDFLVHHRYAQEAGAESDVGLLQSSSSWATDAADLRQQLTDYLGLSAAGVELIATENNSVYTNPGKQTTSLVNGLFLADSIGTVLTTEFNGVLWWDLRNGRETANNNSSSLYGWRLYGDYGIVNGATPPGPADRYPTFYVAKLLQFFGRAGDRLVPAGSDYSLLSAYAARRADGSLTLLVVNKSPTTPLNASITLTGYSPNGTFRAYSYGIPQDEAARTGVGSADVASTTYSGAGSVFGFPFPAYSATVLSLNVAPPPPPTRRPDVLIKTSSETAYLGDNVYNTDATGQTKIQSVNANGSATFHVLIQNDGSATDSFRMQGTGDTAGFTLKYYLGTTGNTDITTAVTAGTYTVSNLAPGASQIVRAVVTVGRSTAVGAIKDSLVTATSVADASKRDAVKARVTVK